MNTSFARNMAATFSLYLLAVSSVYSQTDSANNINAFEGLSLKDLLNVKIESVSKTSESLFDAPLSASVITKEEIQRSGCTSIMEALRLVPGMIVREQSNGNYDIHLRGMDNVPPNSAFEGSSTTTLVMMNNRPIYNYLKGGTFWETIPVDINDIEKIEVIRGPAAALYGPNAVSGVINIITRRFEKEGLHIVANSRNGSNHTIINNASLSYRFNKKWSVTVSGNYQQRDRTQTAYFEPSSNKWLTDPLYFVNIINGDTVRGVQQAFPNQQLASNKYAGNFFIRYDPSHNIKFDLAAGAQHSLVQRVSTENGFTPFSTVSSNSRYADLRARLYALTAQLSYIEGTQVPDHTPGSKYDFSTLDINLEYNYTIKKLSIKPGFTYRSAVYDDTKYSDILNKAGIFNARGLMTTTSGSLRSEYKLFRNKLRLVGGLMANKFNYPDTTYLSYELAASFKPGKNHLIRAVYSRAPRSSSVYDTYVDSRIALVPVGYQNYMLVQLEDEKKLRLLTAGMFEVGYRINLTNRLNMDLELFSIRSKNYSTIIPNDVYVDISGADTITVIPYKATNLPMQLQQKGITVSLNYSAQKLQIKPFITIQRSVMKHYTSYAVTPGGAPYPGNSNPAVNNMYSGMGTKTDVESTPRMFGGLYLNYIPVPGLNINFSAYYYSSQTYYHASNALYNDGVRGIDHIKAKLIANANLSYTVIKGVQLSCSARNIFNDKSREFFYTDEVPFMLVGGLAIDLNKK